jgi:hypothetical protein
MVKGPVDDNYLALRKRAGRKGANYVVLDVMETSSGGAFSWYRVRSTMVGRAFYCDPSVDPTRAEQQSDAPAGGATEPVDELDLGD